MSWNSDGVGMYEEPSKNQRERIRWKNLSQEERQSIYAERRAKNGDRWANENPPRDKPEEYYRDRETLTWEEDDEVRRLVAENPEGMTLYEVAEVFGLCRERVRQVEETALAKINRHLDAFAGSRMTPAQARNRRRHERLKQARAIIAENGRVTSASLSNRTQMTMGMARRFLHESARRGELRFMGNGVFVDREQP